ncbi:hypothetical protein N496_19970 (plasmid) [Clostridium botulinum A2B3 87]|nr:hypothetical protein N496_19970 [Clostridium botulinum A2B3 87]
MFYPPFTKGKTLFLKGGDIMLFLGLFVLISIFVICVLNYCNGFGCVKFKIHIFNFIKIEIESKEKHLEESANTSKCSENP